MSNGTERLLGTGILGIGLVVYAAWSQIVRLNADDVDHNAAIWISDADATPGDTIAMRVRVDAGERVGINSVVVDGAGTQQHFLGSGRTWGNKIRESRIPTDATDSLSFSIHIPDTASIESGLDLAIQVDYEAAMGMVTTFTNDSRTATFEHHLELHSQTSSTLRRVCRAALALGACFVVVALGVVILRRHERRNTKPSQLWWLYALPHAVIGYVVFAHPIAMLVHSPSMLLVAASLVAWLALLLLPAAVIARSPARRYVIAQVMLATDDTTAYRGAKVEVPVHPSLAIEYAWLGAGLSVKRSRRRLKVSNAGMHAIVSVPAADTFGGEPFEIRSTHRELVITMLAVTAPLLGELRCSVDNELGEIRSTPNA